MSYLQIISDWANWSSRLALNHLWQATIFFLMALVVSLLLRRGPARARYLVWLAAAIKFAVPSVLMVLLLNSAGIRPRSVFESPRGSAPTLQYIAPIVSPVSVQSESPSQATLLPQSVATPASEPRARLSWAPLVLSVIWVLGASFFLFSWFKRRHRLSSAIAAGHLVLAGRERDALTTVTTWLGIKKQIDLIVTPEAKEPGVWRVFGPIVVFPQSLTGQLSDEELENLMMHEMAHVLRWDNLVSNLNMFLCCIFWFNPIVWLIDTWLLKEREEACDDVVLRWSGSGEIYAASIKKIYRICLTSRMSGLSAAGGSTLKRRLKRIVANRTSDRFSLAQKLLVLAIMLGSITLSVLAGMQPPDKLVGQSGSVIQMTADSVQQIAARTRDECAQPDIKKCVPSQTAVTATNELGRVVVRSGAEASSPIITGAIALISDQLLGTVSRTAPSTRAPDPVPVYQSSHATDLKKFAGRYGVDPAVMENFVLDVVVINGELWFKPSHARKRRLIAQSAVDYLDSDSLNTRISFILDNMGNVESLKLQGWGPTIIAPRLVLPPPSREGNVVFRLLGFPDARIVAVAGTFNGWNQSQYLFERVGNEWICRVSLPPGKYQYKFIVDGNWLVDPLNAIVVHDERDFENSQLIVH